MDPHVADYIRTNRGTYTREAIRDQLIAAGHAAEEIDWTWDRLAESEPMRASAPSGFRWYVWAVFAVCILAILLSVPGLSFFGVGWLLAFVAIAFWPARWFARQHPRGAASWIGLALVVPIAFIGIGGGICLATVVVVLSAAGF